VGTCIAQVNVPSIVKHGARDPKLDPRDGATYRLPSRPNEGIFYPFYSNNS
jgi:hypothetical protein